MTFTKKLLFIALLIPCLTSCDIQGFIDDLCENSSTLTYCLDFKAVDKNTGENLFANKAIKTSEVTVTAVKENGEEYVVYEGSGWDLYQESIFIDFGDEDDPEALIASLIFEAPNMETVVYNLDIKDKHGEGCMVEYDLVEEVENTVTCEVCQIGQQNISVELAD